MSDELVTLHFKKSELACPCCQELKMPKEMLLFLERLRLSLGKPIHVNSAFRCPHHNAAVGGKITSAHLQGLAVDVSCPTSVQRRSLLEAAFKAGVVNVGVYPTFLHLDIMPKAAGPTCFVLGF